MTVSHEPDTSRTVRWIGDAATGFLRLIDQTRLPMEFVEIDCRDVPAVWEAIKTLRVRGAPAIGIAAAYGAVIGARAQGMHDRPVVRRALRRGHRLPPHQPADRRQPVLGAGPHGCARCRPAQRRRSARFWTDF